MAIGWFLVPYATQTFRGINAGRYCAMQNFSTQIAADGGNWAETEVLGGYAIVKVRAAPATLTAINNAVGFTRLPKDKLDDPLSDLTNPQKVALRDKVISLGYTLEEITARFGNDLGQYTLRQVLRFVASRRLTPRYDPNTQTVVLDGNEVVPLSVDVVDEIVR